MELMFELQILWIILQNKNFVYHTRLLGQAAGYPKQRGIFVSLKYSVVCSNKLKFANFRIHLHTGLEQSTRLIMKRHVRRR